MPAESPIFLNNADELFVDAQNYVSAVQAMDQLRESDMLPGAFIVHREDIQRVISADSQEPVNYQITYQKEETKPLFTAALSIWPDGSWRPTIGVNLYHRF